MDKNEQAIKKDKEIWQYIKSRVYYKDGRIYWKNGQNKDKEAGTVSKKGYRQIFFRYKGKNSMFYTHRIVWFLCKNEIPEFLIDHIDGNPLNNNISNLQRITSKENIRKMKTPKSNKTTKFRGVHKNKKYGRYEAYLSMRINGKNTRVFKKRTGCITSAKFERVRAEIKFFGKQYQFISALDY